MSSSLEDMYDALRSADAAGDTASAQRLASYISSLPASATQPSQVTRLPRSYSEDPSTPEWQAKYGTLSSYSDMPAWQRAAMLTGAGAGSVAPGVALAGKQIGAQLTGGDPNAATEPFSGYTAEERARMNAPLDQSGWGMAGKGAVTAPLGFIAPGVGGSAAIGATLGALTPTTKDQSRVLNTVTGGVLGAGAGAAGNVASWMPGRARQPLMGWRQDTFNQEAARSVGSAADALDQDAIGEAHDRLAAIFRTGRSPNTSIPLGQPSIQAYQGVLNGMENASSAQEFEGNRAVTDFLDHLTAQTPPSAEALGSLVTRLRRQGSQILGREGGNYELGNAYNGLAEHIDGLIQGSIQDPAAAAAYAAARPQYARLETLRWNPSLLNASSGDVNMPNYARWLQRNLSDYSTGGMRDPLAQAASYAQATGEGKPAPEFDIGNIMRWVRYHAGNSAPARLAAGLLSRGGTYSGAAYAAPYAAQGAVPILMPGAAAAAGNDIPPAKRRLIQALSSVPPNQ